MEVSPALRALQAKALRCAAGRDGDTPGPPGPSQLIPGRPGVAVTWHRSLDGVPQDLPALYVGHEFIDALPVHQFQKTGAACEGWGKVWVRSRLGKSCILAGVALCALLLPWSHCRS